MAVTIYRSTDSGAPALPANANYVGASFYMDIIKKCLVDGYGSKAGAGWSLVYEDTTANKRRLAVSNGNGVMEFITWGTRSMAMVMWDSITAPGVGRLYDDSFASVMSTGVNGWKSDGVAAPGVAADNMFGISFGSVHSGNAASIMWTVFADERSAWILFHYPNGNANAEGTDSITSDGGLHSKVFMGALKSPDLERDQLGNLFCFCGARNSATSANASSGANSLSYYWGLRTPNNTVPSVANSSAFKLLGFDTYSGYVANPYSSVRLVMPLLVGYTGSDVVRPAELTSATGEYQFATVPGLANFAAITGGTSSTSFWLHVNKMRGATWNQETYSINGTDWMPWILGNSSSAVFANCGMTDNEEWWA